MHAGSRDLLLYQHRARCTLGASCLPFISTGYTDVGVGLCASWWIWARVCVCACLPDTEADRIFFGCSIEREQIACRCLHQCGYANMCVFVSWQSVDVCERESRGIISQASPRGLRGTITSKGHEGQQRQPVRQGGNPVDVAGPALARLVANTGTWRSHRLPPPMPV